MQVTSPASMNQSKIRISYEIYDISKHSYEAILTLVHERCKNRDYFSFSTQGKKQGHGEQLLIGGL